MSRVQTIIIEEDDGDQRLDRFLKRKFPKITQGHDRKDVPQGRTAFGWRSREGQSSRQYGASNCVFRRCPIGMRPNMRRQAVSVQRIRNSFALA